MAYRMAQILVTSSELKGHFLLRLTKCFVWSLCICRASCWICCRMSLVACWWSVGLLLSYMLTCFTVASVSGNECLSVETSRLHYVVMGMDCWSAYNAAHKYCWTDFFHVWQAACCDMLCSSWAWCQPTGCQNFVGWFGIVVALFITFSTGMGDHF